MAPKRKKGPEVDTSQTTRLRGPRAQSAVEKPTIAHSPSALDSLMKSYEMAVQGRGASPPPAMVEYKAPDGSSMALPDPRMDQKQFWHQMTLVSGSPHPEAHIRLLDELNGVSRKKSASVTSALATILGIAPRDALEGMLAVQMVSIHRLAMDLLASASSPDQSLEAATFRYNQATRLMRLYAAHVDCLNRCRGKAPSEQRVTVEHVHVHEGAQAIVGNVLSQPTAIRPRAAASEDGGRG